MGEHTPGPWEVHDVAEVDEEWEEHHDFRYGIVNHRETAFIAQALESGDARLVAAAPDLLAALEDAVGALDACEWGEWNSRGLPSDPGYGQPSETLVRARAAIAKAKGSEIVAT